jgi:hypothetical protein
MNKNNLVKIFWETIENKPRPKNLRNVVSLNTKLFIKNIKKNNLEYIMDLILKLYSGDVLILKKAVNKKYINELKKKLVAFSTKNPSNFYKMTEGCPNFWRRQDENIAKKYSFKAVRDSFYFFRWNNERFNIWKTFNDFWGCIKMLGGLNYNSYVNNTPKDLVIDRVQVVRYPENTGHTESHFHDPINQRIIISVYMSKKNKDYNNGGTYFFKNNKKKNIENNLDIGDIGLFYSTLHHGVDKVSINKKIKSNYKNKNLFGRWWCGLYSPESNHKNKKRNTSSPLH